MSDDGREAALYRVFLTIVEAKAELDQGWRRLAEEWRALDASRAANDAAASLMSISVVPVGDVAGLATPQATTTWGWEHDTTLGCYRCGCGKRIKDEPRSRKKHARTGHHVDWVASSSRSASALGCKERWRGDRSVYTLARPVL